MSPLIQAQFAQDWQQSPIELGRIDNLVAVRVRWSGKIAEGSKEQVGRKMHGIVYVVGFRDKFVELMIRDVTGDDQPLALCEASALTLHGDSNHPAPHGRPANKQEAPGSGK